MAAALRDDSGARLRLAGACATTGGDYLRLGRLFFSLLGGDGAIERVVSAERLEDVPLPSSSEWRSLGASNGIWAARYCHRERAPSRPAAGFWSRLLGDLFHTPELRPLARRYDCLRACPRPLRFLRPGARDGGGGGGGRLMLVFEFDGIEFELDAMRSDGMAVAEAVTLPRGVTLDEQPLAVPELVSEEALDFACVEADLEATGTVFATAVATAAHPSGGGFRVGCRNTQQAIEAAEAVGDSSFAELSARMQPLSSVSAPRLRDLAAVSDDWRDHSVAGFLRRGGGLKAQLLADNALVLERLGMSHQALVGPLLKASRLQRDARQRLGIPVAALRFFFGGRRFSLTHVHSSGRQGSPFLDGTGSGDCFCLTATDEADARALSLRFEGLAPVMAFRYGFYQDGAYRLEPAEVKRILHGR